VTRRLEKVLDLYAKGRLDEETLTSLNARLRKRGAAIQDQLHARDESPLPVDFRVNADRLRVFLNDMDRWMHEGDGVRRKTLLRHVYQEIRLWPKTGSKPWTRKVEVVANLEALTRAFVVPPTGFEPVFQP